MKLVKTADDLDKLRKAVLAKRSPEKPVVSVCCGTGCRASNSAELKETLEKEIVKQNLKDKIEVKASGCHGFCEHGPIVVMSPKEIFYERVKLSDAEEIVRETVVKSNLIGRLQYIDPAGGERIKTENEVPFYKKQKRKILEKNRLIDPTNILDYVAVGGYEALKRALTGMKADEIIAEIKKSGLRGRGGAGFPTGFKWEFCKRAKGDIKYVICNADEGDPGAYMDRSVLEGNPHSVIEGMIIGAFAIGSNKGYVYVRNEYPLAVKNLTVALAQAREYGFLGKNILGSGFDFDIEIERGAGAFVCGEETALIASIEGKKGEPRQRPPFPATKGLWGKPTNINNVETWANVPLIINKGADWYSRIGTETSKGTKIFSLVGKVVNTGLVEVPMGATLREIIYDIGGGIKGDGEFKAVQTGGPSGGCIPKELLDLPIDYESLAKAGSIMGSGGMIVMDDSTCMVDVAKYFLNFLRDESCGKCLSCREGTQRMWEIVNNICEGKGKKGDLELLEELAVVVKDSSMCGLGQTASNPVLSTLRYFRHEYEAHIKEKKCPARVCKALITYSIDTDKCVGCLLCLKNCPQKAILGELKKPHKIEIEKCIRCGVCNEVCNVKAVLVS
ncbi:MAG: NADH-quinone oxidoreductase subunit NuoF [Elusimicrobia bacterium]|nr:NADH-quinone oxidoreductase subunit NuoF [Elusimicrobiota bacterium]